MDTGRRGSRTTRAACVHQQQQTNNGLADTALGKTRSPAAHLEGATMRVACLHQQQQTISITRAEAMGKLVRRPLTSEGLQHGPHVSLGSKKPPVDPTTQRWLWAKLVRRPFTSKGLQHGPHVSLGSKKPTVDLAPQRWENSYADRSPRRGYNTGCMSPSAARNQPWTSRHSDGGNSSADR